MSLSSRSGPLLTVSVQVESSTNFLMLSGIVYVRIVCLYILYIFTDLFKRDLYKLYNILAMSWPRVPLISFFLHISKKAIKGVIEEKWAAAICI